MNIEDKKDLQSRLEKFANDSNEDYPIILTHIESKYIAGLINADWRK